MSTQTLASYYCAFCDKISNFFKLSIKETRLDPKFDRNTHRILSQMSDRELRDIGISRGDIMHISMGGDIYRGDL
tara:strand:- start:190 stop:414 length:225 start_codon:yes stop_codon:yes gene_type:complete